MKKKKYLPIVQILQSFFPRAEPDLHLLGCRDVGLPVNHSAVTLPPARRERIKVQRLAVRGALHRAEHATELLPGPGRAVRAHVPEKGWDFPGGRHAWLPGWLAGGLRFPRRRRTDAQTQLLLFIYLFFSSWTATAFSASERRWSLCDKNAYKSLKIMMH